MMKPQIFLGGIHEGNNFKKQNAHSGGFLGATFGGFFGATLGDLNDQHLKLQLRGLQYYGRAQRSHLS